MLSEKSLIQEEYKTLRQEILERAKIQAQLEMFSLTAAGIMWSGAALTKSPNIYPLLGICAGILILASAILSASESQAIFKISSYIVARLESFPELELKWETMTYSMHDPKKDSFFSLNRHSLYYLLLTLVNLLLNLAITLQGASIANAVVISVFVFVLIIVSSAIVYPICKNEKAYRGKMLQVNAWRHILKSIPDGTEPLHSADRINRGA